MNCFGDTQPTSMPYGSVLVFVGTIHRVFQASADTNKWTMQRPGPFVSFGWPPGSDEQGDSRKRKFMVSHYGERQAKRLAVAERERQLNLVCATKSGRL